MNKYGYNDYQQLDEIKKAKNVCKSFQDNWGWRGWGW